MEIFQVLVGEGPIVAAAIHSGHALRSAVAEVVALSEADRLREEDPFTDLLAEAAPTRLVGRRSRFEVDLNRPRTQAVYLKPPDAWGLNVWRQSPPQDVVEQSRANYDLFYTTAEALLRKLANRYGRVVVLDIHSYNHRRDGADGPLASDQENPEVNVGSGTMDRQFWAPVVDRLIADLRGFDGLGRPLDVRENVRFKGGRFPAWIHETFPHTVCAPALEFKKTFMDEWTGEVDRRHLSALQLALRQTLPGILASLADLNRASPP